MPETSKFNDTRLLDILFLSELATAVFTGPNLIIQNTNNAMLRIWGKDKSIVGQPFEQAITEPAYSFFVTPLKTVWSTGKTYEESNKKITQMVDGSPHDFYFDVKYQVIRDEAGEMECILHTAIDVTERYNTQQKNSDLKEALQKEQLRIEEQASVNEELEEKVLDRSRSLEISEGKFRSLVEQAPVGICVIRGYDLMVTAVNNNYLKLVGKNRSQLENLTIWEGIPEAADVYAPIMNQVIETGVPFIAHEHHLYLVRNGTTESVFVNFVYEPVTNENGMATDIMVVVTEVTAQVLARKQVQQLNTKLTETNEDLAAINEELTATNEELLATQNKLLKTNADLATSESRFRSLVEQIPTAINVFKNRDLIIDLPNERMLEIWGRTKREVVNKPLLEAMPELAGQPFLKKLDDVLTTGQAYYSSNEKAFIQRKGELEECYFNIVYQPIVNDDGSVTSILQICTEVTKDILASQRIQDLNEELIAINEELINSNRDLQEAKDNYIEVYNELLKNQQDLLTIIDAAGLATFDYDFVTRTFSGNELLRSWFGIAPNEPMNFETAYNVIAKNDKQRIIKAINTSLQHSSGGTYDAEYDIINPVTLVTKTVKARGKTLFNNEKEPVRLSGTLQDITEQKKDEQRKNDFIGMVSHEMKTPLTSLNGYIQLLQITARNNGSDSFMISALDKSKKQLDKMTTMINGFLNMSRLESGKIHIDKTLFDMAVLVKEIEEETTATITSHHFIFEPVEYTQVNADRDKIDHVLNNLISNAVKYSPAGSTIRIACVANNGWTEVTVKDQGIGISSLDIEKLFDRYYRVEGEHMKSIAGFGIGLYLCKEIIERHNGVIWVESEVGKGSTFHFNLPTHN